MTEKLPSGGGENVFAHGSIFGAQLVRRWHVLIDAGETATTLQKDVVRLVVIDRRDLSNNGSPGAGLRPELVIEIRGQRNGHPRFEQEQMSSLDLMHDAIQGN